MTRYEESWSEIALRVCIAVGLAGGIGVLLRLVVG